MSTVAGVRGAHESPVEAVPAARTRRPGRTAYTVVLLLLTAVAVYATLVPLLIQRSGVELVTLTSGSMEPTYPTGSTITISTPEDPAALQPGDVITFRALGNGTVITHRIVERVETASLGQVHYQTKGDANDSPDADLAPASNVIGVVQGPLPRWQEIAVSLQTPRGRLLVYGSLFAVVAVGELLELVRSARRREETS